jgi:hypothetical protein
MIDDLPDISEIDGTSNNIGLSMIPDSARFQKFLKNNNNNNLHNSSGMNSNQDNYKLGYHNINQGSYIDSLPQQNSGMYSSKPPQHLYGSSGGFAPESQMYYEAYEQQYKDNLNCRDVASHISNCHVCSRLYNNDKTYYIIAICVLIIICILLFKRILDV